MNDVRTRRAREIDVVGWLGGLCPGIVTTLITGTAALYYWIEPSYSWLVKEPTDWLGLMVFVGVGVVISALNEQFLTAVKHYVQPARRGK